MTSAPSNHSAACAMAKADVLATGRRGRSQCIGAARFAVGSARNATRDRPAAVANRRKEDIDMDGPSSSLSTRVRAAWTALCGDGSAQAAAAAPMAPASAAAPVAPPAAGAADPRSRTAALELDLQARDQEIERLRQEYERLEQQAQRDSAGAANAGVEALLRRAAPLLSQLATMQALAEAGRTLRVEDTLKLFAKVEQTLTEAGLDRIGAVGQEGPFDPRLHQRLSGADVDAGDAVAVRFVGYALGDNVLLKAMVGRSGAQREPLDPQ